MQTGLLSCFPGWSLCRPLSSRALCRPWAEALWESWFFHFVTVGRSGGTGRRGQADAVRLQGMAPKGLPGEEGCPCAASRCDVRHTTAPPPHPGSPMGPTGHRTVRTREGSAPGGQCAPQADTVLFCHSGAGAGPGAGRRGGGHRDGRGHRLPAAPLQSLQPLLHSAPEAGGRAAAGTCALGVGGEVGGRASPWVPPLSLDHLLAPVLNLRSLAVWGFFPSVTHESHLRWNSVRDH